MGNRARLLVAIPVLIALVAGIGVFALSRAPKPSTAYALVDQSTLAVLSGEVAVQRADGSRITATRAADVPVRVGDRLETGADARGVITFFDGSTTELEPGTTITLQKMDKLPGGGVNVSFNQQVGQTWNRVERLVDANSRFETTTASAVAYVRGTGYKVIVDAAGKTTLEVYEGSVNFEAAGVTVVVQAGFMSSASPGQPPTPPEPIPPSAFGLRIDVQGPARPFLTDNFNRSVGFQPDIDSFGSQIPGTTYRVVGNTQTLELNEPAKSYTLVLNAEGNGGSYNLKVTGLVNGQPVAMRASAGLARALELEELGGQLTQGQHIQTGFDFLSGQIQNFQRPGTLIGGAPANSRMLFTQSQSGNGPKIEQTAIRASSGAASPTGAPAAGTATPVRTATTGVTAIQPTEAPATATVTASATLGIATSTSVATTPTSPPGATATPEQAVAPTDVPTLEPTDVPATPTLPPTATPTPTVTSTGTSTPAGTEAPTLTALATDTPVGTPMGVTPTVPFATRRPQAPPPVSFPGVPGSSLQPRPPLGPIGPGPAGPTTAGQGPAGIKGSTPTIILSTHGGFNPNGASPTATLTAPLGSVTPVPPQEINPSDNLTVRGNYVAAGVGLRNSPSGTINIVGVPGESLIRKAVLYWGIIANVEDPSFKNLTFRGTPITGSLIGTGLDTCWNLNTSYAYRADVTSLVTGNGAYPLTNLANGPATSMLRNGASLVVIYENNDIPRTIILDDGDFVVRDTIVFTLHITGFNVQSGPAGISAKTTFIIGDGQPFTETLGFTASQGTLNLDNTADGSDGDLWDTDTYDVSALFAVGDTFASATMGPNDDCLMWVAQVLSVSSAAPTSTPTPSPTGTTTPTAVTATPTVVPTATLPIGATPTPTLTQTPSAGTPTVAPTSTGGTPTPTLTQTASATGNSTVTPTPTGATPTVLPTSTPTLTQTPVGVNTPTPTLTPTPTPTPTQTRTSTPTSTSTSTPTPTATRTPTPTAPPVAASCVPSTIPRDGTSTEVCSAPGFTPGETVNVTWRFSTGTPSFTDVLVAPSDGLVEDFWTVPTTGFPPGPYTTTFVGQSSGRVAIGTFTVT